MKVFQPGIIIRMINFMRRLRNFKIYANKKAPPRKQRATGQLINRYSCETDGAYLLTPSSFTEERIPEFWGWLG